MYHYTSLLSFSLISVALMSLTAGARKDSGDYWKTAMKDEPMPHALQVLMPSHVAHSLPMKAADCKDDKAVTALARKHALFVGGQKYSLDDDQKVAYVEDGTKASSSLKLPRWIYAYGHEESLGKNKKATHLTEGKEPSSLKVPTWMYAGDQDESLPDGKNLILMDDTKESSSVRLPTWIYAGDHDKSLGDKKKVVSVDDTNDLSSFNRPTWIYAGDH